MKDEKWNINASDVQFAITDKPSGISPDVLHMVSILCDYEYFNKSVLNPEHCLFEIPRMLLSGPNQGNISEYDIDVFKTLCDVITNPLSRYNANIIAEMFLLKHTIINDIRNNLNRLDPSGSGGIIRYNMSDWPYTEKNVARFIARYTHSMNTLNKTIGMHSILSIRNSHNNNKMVINDNKMRLESMVKMLTFELHHLILMSSSKELTNEQINKFINKTLHDYTINIGIPETIYVNEFQKLFTNASNAFVYLRNEKTIDYLTYNPETIVFPLNDDDKPSSHKSDIRHKQIQEMYKKVLKHEIIKTRVINNIQNSKQTNS